MKEITRNDFNLFQNEILGLIKKIDTKSTEKISDLTKRFEKNELMTEQKFENFKYQVEESIKNLETNKIIVNLNDKIKELNTKMEELKTVNNQKISNFERDLSNACFKYDRIFLNNISSPGLIGDGCPYPTMRAFLEYANAKIKDFMNSKEKFGVDFQKYHDWVKSTLDSFKDEFIKYKDEMNETLRNEVKQYDKRSMDKMNAVEDKLSFIRIENGRYNFKLNKKWEELQEKLQLFYVMNDNLIKLYNKARNEILKTQKEVNNICQYLNNNTTGNKTTYDKFNKKIELKSKILNSENALPIINSFDEITKNNMLISEKNNVNNNNRNKKTNNTKLFMKKKTFNLDIGGFNINKLDSKLISSDTSKNAIEEARQNIRMGLSETKIRGKFTNLKNNYLKIGETNELSIFDDKINASENSKTELHNIIEENEHNEKNNNQQQNDKKTSPMHFNLKSNRAFDNLSIFPNKINSFTFERKEIRNDEKKEKEKFDNFYAEEYNEIKSKFEDLYDKSNNKINNIMDHLNTLISKMNKIIFNKNDTISLENEIEYVPIVKNKKLYINDSGNKLVFSMNKSYQSKKEKNIEKNNIPNLKYQTKFNSKLIINDKYINENFKYNNDLGISPNNVAKLFDEKSQRPKNNYERMLRIQSLKKIESYLIKKFTDPN